MTHARTESSAPKRNRSRDAQLIIVTLLMVLLLWFVIANTQKVNVHFWVVTANVSLIVVILLSAALGALSTLLVGLVRHHARSKK